MEYFTSESYKSYERIGEPFKNDKGALYTKVKCKCDRCADGIYAIGVENGHIKPSPYYGGVCLKCDGAGFLIKEVRLYTEKEIAAQEKTKERKKEETEAEIRKMASEKRTEWLITNGFNEEGNTIIYIGNDSYNRKDEFKAAGWKYHPLVGWHNGELNVDCEEKTILTLNEKEIVEFNMYGTGAWKAEIKVLIDKAKEVNKEESRSEWIGLEKEKISNLLVTFKKKTSFQSRYGWSNIYTFENGENILVWFSSTNPDIEEGETYKLTATVKEHKEYKGIKQTVVSRAKLEVI